MPLRRLHSRAIAATLPLLMAGCSLLSSPPPKGALTRIVESGELRVATSGEQPPLSMTSRDGQLLGLDVALARVLAQSMAVEARFVQLPFGRLLEALEKREADIVMSGMTITPKRAERVAFVGPYYTSGKALLTRSPELALVSVASDLDSPEIRLAALEGSTSEEFVRDTLPRARLSVTKRLEEAIERVLSGEVDALVADRETCQFAVLRHPDAGLFASTSTFTVEPMGIAVRLDAPRLANLIQTYLNALSASGALERAQAFWFKDSSWVKELR